MIKKSDILELAKRVSKRSRGGFDNRLMNPAREWLIGVTIFVAAGIAGSIFAAQLQIFYTEIDSRISNSTSGGNLEEFDIIINASNYYKLRTVRFEELANLSYDLATTSVPVETPVEESEEEVIEEETDEVGGVPQPGNL